MAFIQQGVFLKQSYYEHWGDKAFFTCQCNVCWCFLPIQLTAFAYRDYLSFGYVYVGLRGTEELSSQYNINVYTPTLMIFKEHIDKPADVAQVQL